MIQKPINIQGVQKIVLSSEHGHKYLKIHPKYKRGVLENSEYLLQDGH